MIRCKNGHIITLPAVVGNNIKPLVCWLCVISK
jgi:hypothetical protein